MRSNHDLERRVRRVEDDQEQTMQTIREEAAIIAAALGVDPDELIERAEQMAEAEAGLSDAERAEKNRQFFQQHGDHPGVLRAQEGFAAMDAARPRR
jgi:hypothetical protein